MMNTTRAANRLRKLAAEAIVESNFWPRGRTRAELAHAVMQLGYLARSIDAQPGPVVEAMVESTITLIARSAAQRAFGSNA